MPLGTACLNEFKKKNILIITEIVSIICAPENSGVRNTSKYVNKKSFEKFVINYKGTVAYVAITVIKLKIPLKKV